MMTNTKIMLNFINYIVSNSDEVLNSEKFEISRIVQTEDRPYQYRVVTEWSEYFLVILHAYDDSMCVKWDNDLFHYVDGKWKLIATFY